MRALDASEWLKEPELEVVETTKNNTQGNDFTLYARQVTSLADDNASKAKPGTPPRRTP
jgi:hypothetical protein